MVRRGSPAKHPRGSDLGPKGCEEKQCVSRPQAGLCPCLNGLPKPRWWQEALKRRARANFCHDLAPKTHGDPPGCRCDKLMPDTKKWPGQEDPRHQDRGIWGPSFTGEMMATWRSWAWGHRGCDLVVGASWGDGGRLGSADCSLQPQPLGDQEVGLGRKGVALRPQPHTQGFTGPPLSPLLQPVASGPSQLQ